MMTSIWQPTASLNNLQTRARILTKIREFFAARAVLEVETPLLAKFGVTDPHIAAIPVVLADQQQYYLQTSPEYAMKRLLAAGSGSIYQITRAFRNGDVGRYHNPEFTMLEWYRVGFNYFQLMAEVDDLLQAVLKTAPAYLVTYQDLFQQYLGIDPHTTTIAALKDCAMKQQLSLSAAVLKESTLDDWLNILLASCIEPHLTGSTPWIVYDFPASQAALAKISDKAGLAVAERFEVYLDGVELANGYHELTDPKLQMERFLQDQYWRELLQKARMAVDDRLLAALDAGLPDCAGVALGLDRLVMFAVGAATLQEVQAFSLERA